MFASTWWCKSQAIVQAENHTAFRESSNIQEKYSNNDTKQMIRHFVENKVSRSGHETPDRLMPKESSRFRSRNCPLPFERLHGGSLSWQPLTEKRQKEWKSFVRFYVTVLHFSCISFRILSANKIKFNG